MEVNIWVYSKLFFYLFYEVLRRKKISLVIYRIARITLG
jgi:hypothetical protein